MRLRELDALRGALALWVFVGHYLEIIGFRAQGPLGRIVLATWMPVAIFMILSGFAITRSLMVEPVGYRAFLRARVARLYPAYLIGLTLATVAIPAALRVVGELPNPVFRKEASAIFASSSAYYGEHLLVHLTFVHAMIPKALLPLSALAINPPMWSLSVEAQFYVVAPLLVTWLRTPTRWPVILVLVAVSPLLPWLPEYIAAFALGIVTALHIDRLQDDPTIALHVALAVIAASALTRNIMVIAPVALWSGAIVVICWQDGPGFRCVRAMLDNPVPQFGGRISYSLYIYHYPVLMLTLVAVRQVGLQHGTASLALALAAAFPAAIALSALSFYLVERPLYRRFKHWRATADSGPAGASGSGPG